jgi:uncharacterized protein YraI
MRRPALATALLIALSACQAAPSGPPVAAAPVAVQSSAKSNFEPVSGRWQVAKPANLRAGPSTDFPIVGGVRAGEALDVLGKVPGTEWLAVKIGDRHAYIHTRLVIQSDELPPVTQKTVVAVPAPIKQAPVTQIPFTQAPPRAVQTSPLAGPLTAPLAAPVTVPTTAPVTVPTTAPVTAPTTAPVTAPTPLTPAAPPPVPTPAPPPAPVVAPVPTPVTAAVPAVPAVPRAAGDWVATGDPVSLRPSVR